MEMAGPIPSTLHTAGEIFGDYTARRAGLIRALILEADEFFDYCEPWKENLCLYGLPNGNWKVDKPSEDWPELPDPALGINSSRDSMKRPDWLLHVAAHSDAWLFSLASFSAARLNNNDRKRLFNLIYGQSTVRETVINDDPSVYGTMVDQKRREKKPVVGTSGKSRRSTKLSDSQMADSTLAALEDGHEDNKEHSENICGTCGGLYNPTEFWIACDSCERWFHGICVKITPAEADQIGDYMCPNCSMKMSTAESAGQPNNSP